MQHQNTNAVRYDIATRFGNGMPFSIDDLQSVPSMSSILHRLRVTGEIIFHDTVRNERNYQRMKRYVIGKLRSVKAPAEDPIAAWKAVVPGWFPAPVFEGNKRVFINLTDD